MTQSFVGDANVLLEKSNLDLEPDLMTAEDARALMEEYHRAPKKLAEFGETAMAQKLDDAEQLAKVTGTSIGKAKETG